KSKRGDTARGEGLGGVGAKRVTQAGAGPRRIDEEPVGWSIPGGEQGADGAPIRERHRKVLIRRHVVARLSSTCSSSRRLERLSGRTIPHYTHEATRLGAVVIALCQPDMEG